MKQSKFTLIVLVIALIVAIGELVRIKITSHEGVNAGMQKFLPHTKLQLVAQHGPFTLYMDLTSSNKFPDYVLVEGNENVILRENTLSNTLEITHFENGNNVLLTQRDKDGKIFERTASYYDDSNYQTYVYVDRNGDGLWDFLLNYPRSLYYVRSNLSWVVIGQTNN